MPLFSSNPYSLKKSKTLLRHVYHLYLRKKSKLTEENRIYVQKTLTALQTEILNKDKEKAAVLSQQAETLCSTYLKKTPFDQMRDFVFALAFALCIAVVVRQMWFEFYEIPSGSMRPTLKEQDHLVVSKTTFGINLPLTPKHIYFDPSLVQRDSILIFTGENMDIPDVDTLYFYLFPGKKQYIKRLIGKPGDILYFYGGKVFGLDSNDQDISSELQQATLDQIEHIPFIDFERKNSIPPAPVNGVFSPVFVYQMNEPVAKLFVNAKSQATGEMLPLKEVHASNAPLIKNYSDLWGFKNFGMTRLLTRQQVKLFTDQDPSKLENAPLYLEIKHNPSLASTTLIRDPSGRLRPKLGVSTSVIPLQESHLKELFNQMYTARFEVKNGFAYRVGTAPNLTGKNIFLPHLPNVPNGVYEFYYGKAYKIKWKGIAEELPPSHPLYQFDPERLQLFYNIGIEFDTRFTPQTKHQTLTPSRYTYFRNGDLYLLGAPILLKNDPTLTDFLNRETLSQVASPPQNTYLPFIDSGPPLKTDGSLDADFIRHYGIQVPPKMYLVLGDNHAMSADSREFGFVPESNLRGAPSLIFWPPGTRWGTPNQPPYPWMNLPRGIILGTAFITILGSSLYWRSRNRLPLKF